MFCNKKNSEIDKNHKYMMLKESISSLSFYY